MNGPFELIQPESFRPGEFLKAAKLMLCHDDARYFISLILLKTARGQIDRNGFVRLQARYLRNVMNQRTYAAVIDALVDGGAVVRAPYRPGEASFGYRLGDRFKADGHVRRHVRDERLRRRIETWHACAETDRRKRFKPVHLKLEERQRKLEIDSARAREIVRSLPPKSNPWDTQGILVAEIERRRFHCNVGRYGRFSNNITSLQRDVRETLHEKGQRLLSVDISCCQPALIAKTKKERDEGTSNSRTERHNGSGTERRPTIGEEPTDDPVAPKSIYDSTGIPPEGGDFVLYIELVQQGDLYEFLRSELRRRGTEMTRDTIKKRFLTDVVAKRKANGRGAEYPSVVEDVFRSRFPSVYEYIREVNRDGWEHENLIRELQRQESRLVIETVCWDLVTRWPDGFFISLHDAVYCTKEYLAAVESAFRRAFEQSGFPMRLKVA